MLYQKLDVVDHSRTKRMEIATFVIDHPESILPLMEIVFDVTHPLSVKACFSLEYTAKNKLALLLPHLDYFIHHLPVLRNESALRTAAKTCELLILDYYTAKTSITKPYLSHSQLEKITTVTFDWLIGTHKVATKAHAMTCLYHLGCDFSWIHPELQLILEQQFGVESAAFKARARHILAKFK